MEEQFHNKFLNLDLSKSATSLHLDLFNDKEFRGYISRYKSYKTCLCCLMRAPEKVFVCGHAFCDICIRTFGTRCMSKPFHFNVSSCFICGMEANAVFKLIPPTAGIRILSMDGGGVRGIIGLTTLVQLERDLSYLGCPIWDVFDFVIGTSSGMLQ